MFTERRSRVLWKRAGDEVVDVEKRAFRFSRSPLTIDDLTSSYANDDYRLANFKQSPSNAAAGARFFDQQKNKQVLAVSNLRGWYSRAWLTIQSIHIESTSADWVIRPLCILPYGS